MALLIKRTKPIRRFVFSEDKRIISLHNHKTSIKDIASDLNRTEGSIRARMKILENDEKFKDENDLIEYHKEKNTYDIVE